MSPTPLIGGTEQTFNVPGWGLVVYITFTDRNVSVTVTDDAGNKTTTADTTNASVVVAAAP